MRRIGMISFVGIEWGINYEYPVNLSGTWYPFDPRDRDYLYVAIFVGASSRISVACIGRVHRLARVLFGAKLVADDAAGRVFRSGCG